MDRSLFVLALAFLSLASACSDGGETPHGDAGSDAPDAAPATLDGASDAPYDTTPIQAPADQWTWVDAPGSKCANGSATGFAVNPHSSATDVLLYLQGGGDCTTASTCWESNPPQATFLNGYDAATFKSLGAPSFPILDRTNTGNPFAALNMVFVPYCTGDLHAGRAEVDMTLGDGGTQPTYFWGATDLDMFLARVTSTFPNAKRVYLAGASAGGYGTILAFDPIARAFHSRVDGIDDSGPPLVGQIDINPGLAIWGFTPPVGCSPCTSNRDVLDFDQTSQPASRFGFLLFYEDTTISQRYNMSLSDYGKAIDDFSSSLAHDKNEATYIVYNEPSHVVEADPSLAPGYMPWLTKMVTDDPSWGDQTYTHP